MLRAAFVLLLLGDGAATGGESGDPLRDLVDRLRSDRIEEREAVARKIVEAGSAALPELRRAARDTDPDLARRAALLVRRVDAAQLLGRALLARLPEAEALLGGARDQDRTRVFLRAAGVPGISRGALDALAPRALAGALAALEDPDDPCGFVRRTRRNLVDPSQELRDVAAIAAEWDLRSAVPTLRGWLGHGDPEVQACAILALGHLEAPDLQADLLRLLQEGPPECRAAAAVVLGARGSREAVSALVRGLESVDGVLWIRSYQALLELGAGAAIAEIERRLARDECPGRGHLVQALERFRLGESSPWSFRLDGDGMDQTDLATARVLIDRGRLDAVERLVPLLKDSRLGVRRAALWILRDLQARGSVESIRPLLRDPELSGDALGVLSDLGGVSAVGDVLAILREGDPTFPYLAIPALGKFGDSRALPELRRQLERGDEILRRASAQAMMQLGDPDAAPALVRALDDPDDEVRDAALRALLKVSPACSFLRIARLLAEEPNVHIRERQLDPAKRPLLVALVRQALAEADPLVRQGAVEIVYSFSLGECFPEVLGLASDPDPDLRCSAVGTLAGFVRRDALPTFLARIDDDFPRTRQAAASAAGELGSREELLPVLKRTIAKRGIDTALLSCLARIRTRDDIPYFVELLGHHNPKIRGAALDSLVALRAESSASAMVALLEDPEENLRAQAIQALAALGAREGIAPLRRLLGEHARDQSLRVMEALGALGALEAAADLRRFLAEEDSDLRSEAADVLGRVGDRSAIPELRRMLDDPSAEVRESCARALGRLGAREAVPEILTTLRRAEARGENPDGALEALALVPAPEARGELIRLLLRQVRSQDGLRGVVEALTRIDPSAPSAALIAFLDRGDFAPHLLGEPLEYLRGGDPEARKACHRMREPSTARTAIRALVDLGSREAIPTLRRLAREAEASVRDEALRALAALSDRACAADLIPFLASDADDLAPLVERLGTLGCREALPALRRLRRDPRPRVRETALRSCARLGGEDVLAELRPLLDDPHPEVRSRAAAELCQRGDPGGLPLVLQEGILLESLNALRAPEAWRALSERPLPGPLAGTFRRVLETVAREAGLSLELPDDIAGDGECRFSPGQTPSLLDLLLSLPQVTFILQEKRLQLLRRGEAWKFWDDWAAGLKAPSAGASPERPRRR
jgi:HEAT repeat protein